MHQPPPDNVTITTKNKKETLTWDIGDLSADTNRTLEIKVGTEKQGNQLVLPPTGYGEAIYYNGKSSGNSYKPKATAKMVDAVKVDAVQLQGDKDEYNCEESDGEWDTDKCDGCTKIKETLPITQTNTTTEADDDDD